MRAKQGIHSVLLRGPPDGRNDGVGGLLAGVPAKASKPVANAVAKKTGLPAATVTRVVELLIPVILTVPAKRGAKK